MRFDPERLKADLQRLGSRNKVAKEYGVAPSTLFYFMQANGIPSPHPRSRPVREVAAPVRSSELKPGTKVKGDKAEIVLPKTTTPPPELRDDEQVLRDHRLDPVKWRVKSYTDNWWDGPSQDGPIRYYQSKVVAERRPQVEEAGILFESNWRPPAPKRRKLAHALPVMKPLFSDPHFPLHEPALYEGSLAWLNDHDDRLSEVIIPGDEGDWTPFGRHGKNRRINISNNEAILGVYTGLAGWRNAVPDVPIKVIPGNHTHWLQLRLMERYPDLVGVKRPLDDCELLSLRSLVHLDELRIEYLDTLGEYHDIQYEVAPGLLAMHGTKSGPHGGAVQEFQAWEQTSIMQGHDHSGQLTVINKRLPNGLYVQRYAVSMMAMCRKDLGYNPKHNVAQGFPVVTIWPDGRFHIDLAFFNPETGETTHRDWRYRP